MAEKKEFDWIGENLSNPGFTNTDFKENGVNITNTSIAPESVYTSNELIRNTPAFQTNGKFDDYKFHTVYTSLAKRYNDLAKDTHKLDIDNSSPIFHRDNIFVSPERRKQDSNTYATFVLNPNHTTMSLVGFNEEGPITKTPMELAESNHIFDPVTGKFTDDTPEDSFFKNFFKTEVMATWDFDADANGNKTDDPDKIVYHKGEYKLDEDGEYYTEFLDGRSPYGKLVISKFNILTKEDSPMNDYDFFDSDDIKKSTFGSLVRNAVEIAPLFIPYIAPTYIGLSLTLNTTEALGKLTKLFTGSDNKVMSNLEGFGKTFDLGVSQYGLEHTFSAENVLNMVGETFKFIRSQRFIAELGPKLFGKSSLPKNNEEFEAAVKTALEKYIAKNASKWEKKIATLQAEGKDVEAQAAKLEFGIAALEAARSQVNNRIKAFNLIGLQFSTNYMAITFGLNTYETAKALGVGDIEATALTIGAIAGQYKLLNSHIGKWIFPEAKFERLALTLQIKTVSESLYKPVGDGKLVQSAEDLAQNASKAARVNYFLRIANKASEFAGKIYDSPIKNTAKALAVSSLASSIEMTSFLVLDDVIAQIYNTGVWLSGSNGPKMRAWDNMLERYGSSALGGFIAGGMLAKSLYQQAQGFKKIDNTRAAEAIIYAVKEGRENEILDIVDKMDFGNPYLSAVEKLDPKDQNEIWASAATADNQSLAVKQAFREFISFVKNTLESNGAKWTDNELIDANLKKDLRFSGFAKSTTAREYLQRFMDNNYKIVKLVNDLTNKTPKENMETGVTDKELSEANKAGVKTPRSTDDTVKQLKEALKWKDDFLKGEFRQDFIEKATFETNLGISNGYIDSYFIPWCETQKQMDFREIPKNELLSLAVDFKKYKKESFPDFLDMAFTLFKEGNKTFSPIIEKGVHELDKSSEIIKLTNVVKLHSQGYISNAVRIPIREEFDAVAAGVSNRETVNNLIAGLFSEYSTPELRTKNSEIVKAWGVLDELEEARKNPDKPQPLIKVSEAWIDNKQGLEFLQLQIYLKVFDKIADSIINHPKDLEYLDENIKNDLVEALLLQKGTLGEQRTIIADVLLRRQIDEKEEYVNFGTESLQVMKKLQQAADIIKNSKDVVIKSMDEFSLKFSKRGVKVAKTLSSLRDKLYGVKGEVNRFFVGEDVRQDIRDILSIINMYRNSLAAAATETESLINIVGFNALHNELAGKLELVEITPNDAAIFLDRLDRIEDNILFYKQIADNASKSKLEETAHFDLNTKRVIFKKLGSFIDKIAGNTSWKGVDTLKTTLSKFNELKELYSKTNITEEDIKSNKTYRRLAIMFEQAIHNFFAENKENIDNTEKLGNFLLEFIDPWETIYNNIFSPENNKLTMDGELKNSKGLVFYLATLCGLNPELFYGTLKKSGTRDVAPIDSLTLYTYFGCSYFFNRDIFEKFTKSYNFALEKQLDKAISEKESKLAQADSELKKVLQESIDKDKIIKKDLKTISIYVNYDAIALIEAGAGAGKTDSILKQIVHFINVAKPELLNKVFVTSNDKKSAEELFDKFELKANDKEASVKEASELMRFISKDWSLEFNEDGTLKLTEGKEYTINKETGEIVPTWSLNAVESKNVPDLIVIDEVSHFSLLDIMLLNKFAKKYGTKVIVAGDFEQSGLKGIISYTNNEGRKINNKLQCDNGNFIHLPKLDICIRTENELLDINLAGFKTLFPKLYDAIDPRASLPNTLAVHYYQDKISKELYGLYRTNQINKAIQKIDELYSTLKEGELISYIYNNESSAIYKYIKQKYNKLTDYKKGNSALGKENKYYIVDIDAPLAQISDLPKGTLTAGVNEDTVKNLYTALTRSKQGTLLVMPSEYLGLTYLELVEDNSTTKINISENDIYKSKEDTNELYSELYPNDVEVIYHDPLKKNAEGKIIHENDSEDKNNDEETISTKLPESFKVDRLPGQDGPTIITNTEGLEIPISSNIVIITSDNELYEIDTNHLRDNIDSYKSDNKLPILDSHGISQEINADTVIKVLDGANDKVLCQIERPVEDGEQSQYTNGTLVYRRRENGGVDCGSIYEVDANGTITIRYTDDDNQIRELSIEKEDPLLKLWEFTPPIEDENEDAIGETDPSKIHMNDDAPVENGDDNSKKNKNERDLIENSYGLTITLGSKQKIKLTWKEEEKADSNDKAIYSIYDDLSTSELIIYHLFTHAAHITGYTKTPDGKIMLPDNSDVRIDGVNGIMRLAKLYSDAWAKRFIPTGRQEEDAATEQYVILIIEAIKNYAYTINDNLALLNKILEVFEINNTPEAKRMELSFGFEYDTNFNDKTDFAAYMRNFENEKQYGILGTGKLLTNSKNKHLVLKIREVDGENVKEYLSIQLAVLPSFITMMENYSGTADAQGDLYDIYNEWKHFRANNPDMSLPKASEEFAKICFEFVKNNKSAEHPIKGAATIGMLAALFPKDTGQYCAFGTKWNLALNFRSSGVFLTSQERGVHYEENADLASEKVLPSLIQIENTGTHLISNILISKNTLTDIDGTVLVKAGTPFVLMAGKDRLPRPTEGKRSNGSNADLTKILIDEFADEIGKKDVNNPVKLFYINSINADFKEYYDNLNRVYNKKSDGSNTPKTIIGNYKTAYYILNEIFNGNTLESKEIIDLIKEEFKATTSSNRLLKEFEEVQKIIKQINEAGENLDNILKANSGITDKKGNLISNSSRLLTFLYKAVVKNLFLIGDYNEVRSLSKRASSLKSKVETLMLNKWEGIPYTVGYKHKKPGNNVVERLVSYNGVAAAFIEAETDSDNRFTIYGKEAKLNGKPDTTILLGNITKFLIMLCKETKSKGYGFKIEHEVEDYDPEFTYYGTEEAKKALDKNLMKVSQVGELADALYAKGYPTIQVSGKKYVFMPNADAKDDSGNLLKIIHIYAKKNKDIPNYIDTTGINNSNRLIIYENGDFAYAKVITKTNGLPELKWEFHKKGTTPVDVKPINDIKLTVYKILSTGEEVTIDKLLNNDDYASLDIDTILEDSQGNQLDLMQIRANAANTEKEAGLYVSTFFKWINEQRKNPEKEAVIEACMETLDIEILNYDANDAQNTYKAIMGLIDSSNPLTNEKMYKNLEEFKEKMKNALKAEIEGHDSTINKFIDRICSMYELLEKHDISKCFG